MLYEVITILYKFPESKCFFQGIVPALIFCGAQEDRRSFHRYLQSWCFPPDVDASRGVEEHDAVAEGADRLVFDHEMSDDVEELFVAS